MKKHAIAVTLIMLVMPTAVSLAQSSASFRLEESVFNAGGHPSQGVTMSSASFRISMDSVAENVGGVNMESTSYRVDSGFGTACRPPGIITGLHFAAIDTIMWDADSAAETYNLYRDKLGRITDYGACFKTGLTSPRAVDGELPGPGGAYFYLATAVNRLAEEGGKGSDSNGDTREGNWCP